MFSAYLIFSIGLIVSVFNICLWIPIIRAQLRQFGTNNMNFKIKKYLLIFSLISIISNLTPVWFDIYKLASGVTQPTNIGYAYITSQYLYRTVTAVMFYLVYKV